jgi:hypothetical protein
MSTRQGNNKKQGQRYQNTFKYRHNKGSKKTAFVLNLKVGGVCARCYDILQWRREFRKYKPRKTPGFCNVCTERTVKQAYCTICKPCAQQAGKCQKCGETKAKLIMQPITEKVPMASAPHLSIAQLAPHGRPRSQCVLWYGC